MKVTQHVPTFIEMDKARFEGDIQSLALLMQEPWVQNFQVAPGFHQFVRRAYDEDLFLLMAEFDGGKRFYVVARMEGNDADELTRALLNWKEPLI